MDSFLVFTLFFASAFAHSAFHSKIQGSSGNVAMDIDKKQLTSDPMLKIAEGLENIRTAGGEPIVLKCKAAYIPAAIFMWTFNGKPIQGNLALSVEEKMMNVGKPIVESGMLSSTYTIACPSPVNSGTYKCIVSNGHQTVESSAEVEIEGDSMGCNSRLQSPPSIVQWTDSRFEMETNAATLICRADKAAEFVWMFNGMKIRNGGRYEIHQQGDLLIKNIQWDDMGNYVCIARNKYGETEESTFLYPTEERTL